MISSDFSLMLIGILRLLDRLNARVRLLVGLLMIVATLCVGAQILVRFVFTFGGLYVAAPWTEEIARYAVVWSSMLGVGYLCRIDGLITVDTLPHMVPRPLANVLKLVSAVTTMAFFAWLFDIGFDWTWSTFETSAVLKIPMAWIYASLPIGSALAFVNLVAFLVEGILLKRDLMPKSSGPEAGVE